ncbi:hypothetical protein A359_05680 [secondary endosymbiont of Ctenarytaina eucalypti]|uniref:Uncharacterized protein n=1 Tax=secondary endosymbiont of Ctenarytaina eucalypti TaxID=1199245 RepID=J3TXM0_9ENTR|nr:hypothetical protein A359_05680 [secondary endosymbiont of Ctenarytaina eucalypti]
MGYQTEYLFRYVWMLIAINLHDSKWRVVFIYAHERRCSRNFDTKLLQ